MAGDRIGSGTLTAWMLPEETKDLTACGNGSVRLYGDGAALFGALLASSLNEILDRRSVGSEQNA